jgi:hypothetical protein
MIVVAEQADWGVLLCLFQHVVFLVIVIGNRRPAAGGAESRTAGEKEEADVPPVFDQPVQAWCNEVTVDICSAS